MTSSEVREILERFLIRMDQGELPELDALLREHPEHAEALRKLFAEECERLEACCPTPPVPGPASVRGDGQRLFVAEVVARLSGRGSGFERYALRGEIGKGGMGTVLRVWDQDLRRELAMKVTLDERSGDPPSAQASKVARFLEEAQVTSQLDHPGIVPVHELGLDREGRLYFTMKLVKGRTFAQVLDLVRDGAEGWTEARALGVIQRVCEAMAYAHDKGVLHRDLKPANVMVGAFGEVYVMDWGLARILGADGRAGAGVGVGEPVPDDGIGSDRAARRGADPSSSLLTRDGQVVGTPAYMPPEQAAGRIEEVGPHSDVYAVGAMIRHLLTGRPPHAHLRRARDGDSVRSPVEDDPPPPSSAPSELVAICAKAMAADWRARYRDMREMAADVAAFLEGRVVRAHESGALAQARKWVKRNRGLSAAVAAGLLALVCGLGVSLALKARSDAHALRAQRIAAFLEEMLAGVRPSVALGRDTTMLREMMDAARTRIEAGELTVAPEAELRLLHLIGSTYRDIAQYDRAEPLLQRAAARARTLLDRDDPLRAAIVSDLALLLDARGDPAEAEPLAREALESRRRIHRGDDADVAASLQNLATVLRSRGELAEVERLLREAVGMLERLDPAGSEGLAMSLNNLSVVLEERGDTGAAEACARRALEICRERLPADHPLAAANANVLATLLAARGDFAGAEALNRETLALQRRLHEGDHPDTAASLNNLAFALFQRRDYAAAEQSFRAALDMQRRLIRGDDAELATSLDSLAATRVAQGDLAGAEALQVEALGMRRRLFPEGHPDLALGLHNLAAVLRNRGDGEHAEPLAREAVEMSRRVLPPDHPQLPVILAGLGLVLEQRGELAEAETTFREALAACERRVADGDGDAATGQRLSQCERNLARVLLRQSRFEEAEALLLPRVPEQDDAGYPDHLSLLIELYVAWEAAEPGRGHAADVQGWQGERDAWLGKKSEPR